MAPRTGRFGRKEYPILVEKYLRDWGILHALREFISNAFDAEVQTGGRSKAEIEYNKGKSLLKIRNRGVEVSREALLLGGTSKDEDPTLIGTYGSGMKEGFVVAVRDGYTVTVKNGCEETWRPTIQHSKEWGSKVLTIDIVQASRKEPMFEIEVEGLSQEVWEAATQMFTRLQKDRGALGVVEEFLHDVDLLRSSQQKGKFYCKGVFVTKTDNYAFGYNFRSRLDMNRDRKIADNLSEKVAEIWVEKVARPGAESFRALAYDLLLGGDCGEATAIREHRRYGISEAMAAEFQLRHGTDVVVVSSPEEAAKVAHFGAASVMLPQMLFDVVSVGSTSNTAAKYLKGRNNDFSRKYVLSDLTNEQQKAWTFAVSILVAAVPTLDMSRVSIVDFISDGLLGLHSNDKGICVSVKCLDRGFQMVLIALIHEFAHDYGIDGSIEHREWIDRYTEACFVKMAEGFTAPVAVVQPKVSRKEVVADYLSQHIGTKKIAEYAERGLHLPENQVPILFSMIRGQVLESLKDGAD